MVAPAYVSVACNVALASMDMRTNPAIVGKRIQEHREEWFLNVAVAHGNMMASLLSKKILRIANGFQGCISKNPGFSGYQFFSIVVFLSEKSVQASAARPQLHDTTVITDCLCSEETCQMKKQQCAQQL